MNETLKAYYLLTALFFTLIWNISFGQDPWINEIHYDNSGTDSNEGIEIAAPAGTDLSCYNLVLYNGGTSTSYATINLSGIVPDEGCGYGTIWFPIAPIQNGAPDGIALIDCGSSVIQFLSYEGVLTATSGPANGMTSTDIGVSETSITGTTESLQLTGTGSSYGDFTWQSPSASSNGSLNVGQSISPCGSANTISITSLSSLSFSVDCSTQSPGLGIIDFTSTGVFNSSNSYIVELSDASGSFSNPVEIGSLTSIANSGTISFTIPTTMATGTGYRIRIVSSDPVTSSADNGSDISITQSSSCEPPHMTSVIINSCNIFCSEGNNELVFGATGDYSILVNETNFGFSYSNTGNLVSYTDILTSNPSATQEMNDQCSTSNPFIDAYGTTIPANSSWILANDAICPSDALNWAGLCNSGPIYVIYSTDVSWNLSGNFSNDPSAANPLRPYQTSITTTTGETFTIDYETDGDQYPNDDGVFATFDSNGGPATTYGDDDCGFFPLLLPVELVSFQGISINGSNVLLWTTESEFKTSHFSIERTIDGKDWENIGIVSAAGNSSIKLNYELVDSRHANDLNIYRLRQTDHDGTELVFTQYVTIDNRIDGGKKLIGIYNLMGQEVDKNYKGIRIHRYSDGTSKKVLKS